VYVLEHLYAQISVKVNNDAVPFRLTRARLTRIVPEGDISLSGADKTSKLTSGNDETFQNNWIAPKDADCSTFTDAAGNSVKYAKSGIALMQYSYPYTTPKDATTKQRIMMLVEGYYSAGDYDHVEKPCYYAIPLANLKASHHYKINIIGASEEGASTPADAEKTPNGILVTFEDDSENIKNIITDGQNVLAVQDTISIPAGGATPWSFLIKARTLTTGSDTPAITVTPKNSAAAAAATWITGLDNYAAWKVEKISNDEENENNLYSAEITGRVNVSPNNGSERSVVYTISLDGTSLKRDVVFIQRSNTNLKYSGSTTTPISSIKLEIKKGSTTVATIDDYLGFINPKAVTGTPTVTCRGIQPSENGDRIRNLGLHMPMPNGGKTYIYTITLNNSVSISPSKLTYTFKDDEIPDGGSTAYDYVTTSDYITITQGSATFTLDLYHTGFFHKDGSNWYYYEVMQQENDDLYWLDRNLGATATGMGVRLLNGDYYNSPLPLVGNKAFGGRYSANPTCPDGWRVPSYPQLRSLTVSAGFGITRRYTDNQEAYYAPSYQFDAIENGESKKIRSYFPANLLQTSSGLAGQAGSGYYLSTTSAGNAGYYKVMQLTGMNITAQNMNMGTGGYQISVRCCAGSHNPSTDGTSYKCKVEGYTNVYMYYLNNDGSKTSLNTWPGDQIAIRGDLNRYHPFEITPTMNYDTNRLYVIFNTIDADGVVIESNVSETDRKNRSGIKFVMNGSYSKNNTPYGTERVGQVGNWTSASSGDDSYDDEKFRLYGDFNGYGWG
ncbi:MAG: hypothetical protein K2M03_05955, partial [Muribaculaceae bacterium]|nr:hypothetical protein [Muribaculaceae bacterium]